MSTELQSGMLPLFAFITESVVTFQLAPEHTTEEQLLISTRGAHECSDLYCAAFSDKLIS